MDLLKFPDFLSTQAHSDVLRKAKQACKAPPKAQGEVMDSIWFQVLFWPIWAGVAAYKAIDFIAEAFQIQDSVYEE
jgi:hypothetical protein